MARVVYLPLYWLGVPKLRTFVFLASVIGIGMMLCPLLLPCASFRSANEQIFQSVEVPVSGLPL